MRKDYQKNGLPPIFSALGKRKPLPISQEEQEEIFEVVEIPKEIIPSIKEMPFFDITDSFGLRIVTHRETGYIMLLKGTLRAYIFNRVSCLECTLYNETSGQDETVGYVRGNITSIPEITKTEIQEKFLFQPTDFEEYPRGYPRETESHFAKEHRTIRVEVNGKMKKQKVSTERPVKTREKWNSAEEWGFKLLLEHSVPLEELALFFQDTIRCMKERARSRGYWNILRSRELEARELQRKQEEEWKEQGMFLKDGVLMRKVRK